MKLPSLAFIALFLLSASVSADDNIAPEKRRTALYSMASQTGLSGLWSSPANTPRYNPERPLALYIGGGFYFNDSENLIDAFLELQEAGEAVEASARSNPIGFVTVDVEPTIAAMEALDGKVLTIAAGSAQAIPLPPFRGYEFALLNSFSMRTASSFNYDEGDAQRLRESTRTAGFSASDLESEILATGVIIADSGLNVARDFFHDYGQTRIGTTIKLQSINFFERGVDIDDYEEEKLVDRERDIKRHTLVNADIGLSQYWKKNIQTHITVTNVNARTYRGERGSRYHHRPGLKVGTGWIGGRNTLLMEVDATSSQNGFGLLRDEQRVRLAGGHKINDKLGVNGAYQHVMQGRDDHAVSVGANWQPWQWLKLNSSFVYAGSREKGVGLSAELRFPGL